MEKELREIMDEQNELSKKSDTVLALEKKAKSGEGLSAYIMGRAYYSGELNMTVNYQKSFEWYEYGYSKLNDPRCQYGWAMFFYDDGESESEGVVKKDNTFANKFFADALPKLEKLADHGDMYANFILGAYYNYAIGGVKKDFAQALKYIQKSADLGHCGACFDMGKFYAQGRGVTKDIQKAKQYYKKAIALGSTRAKTSLQELEKE